MSKKDFVLIARTIAGLPNDSRRADVALRFADALRSTNPRFDVERFLKACNG